jgi:hypothetical protein
MSRIRLTLALIAAAGLTCGTAFAQMSPPATNPTPAAKMAPAPKPAATAPASSQPSTATKVENWTTKQWNATKAKWSKDKAKWNACNKEATNQKLSGRKSWSSLYDCMSKV